MLTADVVKDYKLTVMIPGVTNWEEVEELLESIAARGLDEIRAEGIQDEEIRIERFLEMRYQGQSYELSVPFSTNFASDFHERHYQTYGYDRPDAPVELVNLHIRAIGEVQKPSLQEGDSGPPDPAPALIGTGSVVFTKGTMEIPFYQAESLRSGNHIPGPALVVREDTTILIPPSDWAEVDLYNNILIHLQKGVGEASNPRN
jgi:N-methylhydantoinase A